MGETKIQRYKDIASSILYQQLYSEPNYIRDRSSTIKITVKGSGKIIKKMRKFLLAEIAVWDSNKEMEYMRSLAEKFLLKNNLLQANYKKKLEPLLEEQLTDKSFRFLLFISEVIKEVQEKSTKQLIKTIRKKLTKKQTKKEITQRLNDLSEQSNANFSLLINLSILNEYAKIVELPPVLEKYNEYFEKVIELLLK